MRSQRFARLSEALDNGQPARALELLKAHRARFASAKLKPERDALTALAQCALGDRDAARSYLRDHPQSVLNDRIERACKLRREDP